MGMFPELRSTLMTILAVFGTRPRKSRRLNLALTENLWYFGSKENPGGCARFCLKKFQISLSICSPLCTTETETDVRYEILAPRQVWLKNCDVCFWPEKLLDLRCCHVIQRGYMLNNTVLLKIKIAVCYFDNHGVQCCRKIQNHRVDMVFGFCTKKKTRFQQVSVSMEKIIVRAIMAQENDDAWFCHRFFDSHKKIVGGLLVWPKKIPVVILSLNKNFDVRFWH